MGLLNEEYIKCKLNGCGYQSQAMKGRTPQSESEKFCTQKLSTVLLRSYCGAVRMVRHHSVFFVRVAVALGLGINEVYR